MKLSVIICTRNRANSLITCLDSIVVSLSKALANESEIVVVDNNSEDNTTNIVKQWARSCPFEVTVIFEAKRGLAAARNCAVASAKGELLAFTDDDCRVDENYISDLFDHYEKDNELVLRGGRIELGDTTDLQITVKTSLAYSSWNKNKSSAKYDCLCGSISGCNMVMPRSLVNRLGLFDTRFGSGSIIPAGEDSDYIFRAYIAGINIEYVPNMTVTHYHGRKKIEEGKKLLKTYMIGTGALYAKHFVKDYNLSRPFYWDIKDAIREIISGKNNCRPDIGFSYKHKVYYCIVGVIQYLYLLIVGKKL